MKRRKTGKNIWEIVVERNTVFNSFFGQKKHQSVAEL